LLEFNSYQIGVESWGLRGKTPKNTGLALLGPLLKYEYLTLVLPLPDRLTCGQIAAIYLQWPVNQLGVV